MGRNLRPRGQRPGPHKHWREVRGISFASGRAGKGRSSCCVPGQQSIPDPTLAVRARLYFPGRSCGSGVGTELVGGSCVCSRLSGSGPQRDEPSQQQVADATSAWREGVVTRAFLTASPCVLSFLTVWWSQGSGMSYMSAQISQNKHPSS